jgi:iron complex outermembrane receptor protein
MYGLAAGTELQAQGLITGTLADAQSEVPFADVVLYREATREPFRVTTSDEQGAFRLPNLPFGTYRLQVREVGHEATDRTVVLTEQAPLARMGTLVLRPLVTQLGEVQVRSDIGVTQIAPGKTVYNAADLPVAQGGTAGDILKLMPSVAMGGPPGVPRDVRYRGLEKSYTLVLIDGKNTGLQGNSRETIVNQIPASAIERIEIISNPGPQYDADGVNGVVNIILKKNRQTGTHGSVGAFVDNRLGYNLSAGLSHRMKRADVSVQFDRNLQNMQEGFGIRETTDQTRYKGEAVDGYSRISALENRYFPSQNLKIGTRFYATPRTTIGAEYLRGFQHENRLKTTDTRVLTATEQFRDRTLRTEDRMEWLDFQNWNADIRHTFRDQSRWTASFNQSRNNSPKNRTQTDQKLGVDGTPTNAQPALQQVSEGATDRNTFLQTDYQRPVSGFYTFRAGYKYSHRQRTSTNETRRFDYKTQRYVPALSGTDNFDYDEAIHALYVANDFTYRRLRAEVGFRQEWVRYTSASTVKQTQGAGTYALPLPVLNLYYNLDTTQYIKLSFGRRVRRPDMKQLNPFVDSSDVAKIKAGNPDLQPERSWSYEIGYQKNWRRVSFGVNLFRRDIVGVIQKLLLDVSPGVVLERQENFSSAYVQGIELIGAVQPTRWWSVNANYARYGSALRDVRLEAGALSDQFAWSGKLISDVQLRRAGLFAQVAYNAVGPKLSAQKTENTIQYWEAALSKTIRGRGTLVLRASDLFNQNRKVTTEQTSALLSTRVQAAPGRLVSMGFTYQF